jgi:S-DNA-T family DNA segregation ATPase FtsK/SpoIIIE
MGIFFKKFKGDIKSIGFLGISLFIGLALISYNPKDPSFNSLGQGLKTLNYCGILGSFLADIIYQSLGLPAWLMVAGLFQAAILSFKGEAVELRNIRIIWMALLVSSLSALMSIYWSEVKVFEQQIYLGGLLGLGLSTGLIKVLNSVGAQILLWAITAMLIVFCFEVSINEIVMNLAGFIQAQVRKFEKSDFYKTIRFPTIKKIIVGNDFSQAHR